MTYPKKLDSGELLEFMIAYAKKYNQFTPTPGFLAQFYNVTIPCIHQKLKQLEKRGKIVRLKRNKNFVAYVIV
jgi:DNA-binding MarR family transcriptional regulator